MKLKHILAIGAHPGDMEISCGAVLAAHHAKGNRITIVHLTSEDNYLKTEAEEAAYTINARLIQGNFEHQKLIASIETKSFIFNLIQEIRPTIIITHWKHSRNQDHKSTHEIVVTTLNKNLYQSIYFAENWDDREEFNPIIYVDVSRFMDTWIKMVNSFSKFKKNNYIDYYLALAKIRGIESNFDYACAFRTFSNNKQCIDILP